MDSIDAKVFTLITALTLMTVEILKTFLPKLVGGREAKVALLLPILFTVGAKAAGFFAATEWVDALLWAVGGGAASGIGHDKVWDPLKSFVKGFFAKAPPSA